MKTRVVLTLVLLVLVSASAFAVAPQFWRVRNAEELLEGEIEGLAVTSRGELRPAPAFTRIATFTDPFVLSQVTSPNGDRFFGTGNDGKVYRLRGSELKVLFTAPEPEIYAVAFTNGALFAASSPHGKIYRIDPESGKESVFHDPKEAYIWALRVLNNGDLAVGTGVEGKLLRITPQGQAKTIFDAPETHIRTIAERKDGTLLVGGSGKGRIYAVRGEGNAHALFDSNLSEISTIYVAEDGTAWAGGVSNILPTTAPPKPQQQQQQNKQGSGQQQSGSNPSGSEQKKEETATAEVSISFDDGSASAQAGSGELYRINTDDFVEVVRKFDREMIYAISGGRDGAILLSTGPNGRLYEYRSGELALVATVPEKQVVSISNEREATVVTTTNSGAVYRMQNGLTSKAEFRSQVKDLERFSRFGHYRIEGAQVGDGRVAIAFRSGNTRTPDATWSNWTTPVAAAEGAVGAPAGRYIQWKLTVPKPSKEMVIDAVTVAFVNRNVAPVIEGVAVQDPAVVFITSAYPASPQVVEATNPDEYGIFSSLDTPREKSEPGKRMFRKGFRTITWRASDPNGDTLRYTIAFRKKGSDRWLRLRENIDESQVNFDTSQLPDGLYELKLGATDAQDNPEQPLTDTKEGIEFQVDNTPPAVAFSNGNDDVIVRITDNLSPIGKVEYSADAQKWVRLTPIDGIADSGDERFSLKRTAIDGKFVIVRAVDGYYNVATQSVNLP